MEISETLRIVYEKFKFFDDFLQNEENLDLDRINKKKLISALRESSLLNENCEKFVNLLFEETEENREGITREKFIETYKRLISKYIDEENFEEDVNYSSVIIPRGKIANEKEIQEGKDEEENVLQGKEKDLNDSNNLYQNIKPGESAEQSEILFAEKSNEINNDDDISIDPNNLFYNLNFEDVLTKKTHSEGPSVVKPTNTFNFNSNNDLINVKEKKKIFSKNFLEEAHKLNQNFKSSLDTKNLKISHQTQNPDMENKFNPLKNSSGNFINYMQNVNINLNNYGNFNLLDPMSANRINNSNNKNHFILNKITSNTNSAQKCKLNFNLIAQKINSINSQSQNLKQKLKEVYQELNKKDENCYRNVSSHNDFQNTWENEDIIRDRNKEEGNFNEFENFLENKFENIQEINKLKTKLSESKDVLAHDYFTDIFKSLKSFNQNQKNISTLNSISERLNNKSIKLIHGIHNLEYISPINPNTNNKNASSIINKNKFQDLKKLLRNPNEIESVENINPSNVFKRKYETEKFKSFDEIEEKINKLKKTKMANKRKSLINMNVCSSMPINHQNRETDRKKIQNLINNLLDDENIINLEHEIEDKNLYEVEKRIHTETYDKVQAENEKGVETEIEFLMDQN